MKILLLCYEYPPIGGGGGVGARQYAAAWAAAGHSVTVLTSRAGDLPFEAIEEGVTVRRLRTFGKPDRATSSLLSMMCYVAFGILHLLRRRRHYARHDVVNTHFVVPTGPLGFFASRVLRIPNVLTIIGGDIHDPSKKSSPHRIPVLRALNRFLMKSADEVVAISSDTKRRAETYYRVERPIEIIHYGFIPIEGTPPPPDELAALEGRFLLISVGRLVERKGFGFLIEALESLPPRIHLLLVGDGPLESDLRETALRHGVDERVHWLGYQTREAIIGWMRESDCYVLSSLHEGLGIVVQEAMYSGLPVVATDNGGQVDLVEAGRNGLLVKPGDPGALAAAIDALYRDPQLAATMRRHNQEDINRWEMASCGERYLELFRRTVGGA